ncbi:MAG: MFS transporter, partial [Pseudomonadota bacterium]
MALPALLERVRDRAVMVTAGFLLSGLGLATGLWATALGWPEWPVLLVIWCGLGAANTAILTPAGRLLRHSAHAEDRPAIFAAQFALSHALWLLAYPLAGVLGAGLGVAWAL